MKFNPVKIAKDGALNCLAFFHIGAFYIYTHNLASKEGRLQKEGPHSLRPKIEDSSIPNVVKEIRFHLFMPKDATRPGQGER